MTTTTVYSKTSDGDVYSEDATYSVARAGTGSMGAITNGSSSYLYHRLNAGNYRCDEHFFQWDTSSIGSDQISSATLSLYIQVVISDDGAWTGEARSLDWGTTLTTADWIAGASLGSQTLLATLATGDITGLQYNDFTESGTALRDWINGSGDSRLLVNHSEHRLGNTPTGDNYWQTFFAEDSGTTRDPKLTVVHTTVVTGTATLSGTGSITAAGTIWLQTAAATLSGTGTLTASGYGKTVQPYTSAQLAELSHGGRRQDTIRYDLLDQHGNLTGQIHPTQTATIKVDVDAKIGRTLTGLALTPDETGDIDPYTDRVRPVWTIGGTAYNLGVFVWGQTSRTRSTVGLQLTGGTCYDLTFVLDQPIDQAYAVAKGDVLVDAIADLAGQAGIVDTSIAAPSLTAGAPLGWPAGHSRLAIIRHLSRLAGTVTYFNNDGQFVVEPVPVPGVDGYDFWYEEVGTVLHGADEQDDLWGRPNRWVAVATDARQVPVVGSYELPADHPASIVNRGFEVVKVIDAAGVTSVAAAEARAREEARADAPVTEMVTFDAVADPRHDTYDIVAWRGTEHLEVGWTLQVRPGGNHQHRLRRIRL